MCYFDYRGGVLEQLKISYMSHCSVGKWSSTVGFSPVTFVVLSWSKVAVFQKRGNIDGGVGAVRRSRRRDRQNSKPENHGDFKQLRDQMMTIKRDGEFIKGWDDWLTHWDEKSVRLKRRVRGKENSRNGPRKSGITIPYSEFPSKSVQR